MGARRALLLLLPLAVAGCGGSSHDAELQPPPATGPPPHAGGTLQLTLGAGQVALDPAYATTPAARRIAFATCTPPFTYPDAPAPEGNTLVPGLARDLPYTTRDFRSFVF